MQEPEPEIVLFWSLTRSHLRIVFWNGDSRALAYAEFGPDHVSALACQIGRPHFAMSDLDADAGQVVDDIIE